MPASSDYCKAFPEKVRTKKESATETSKRPGLHAIFSQAVCVYAYDMDCEELYTSDKLAYDSEKDLL
jgi:hypothetical protein